MCDVCKLEFSALNRRHHCRNCGEAVCGSCSLSQMRVEVAVFGTDKGTANPSSKQKVCDLCFTGTRVVDPARALDMLRWWDGEDDGNASERSSRSGSEHRKSTAAVEAASAVVPTKVAAERLEKPPTKCRPSVGKRGLFRSGSNNAEGGVLEKLKEAFPEHGEEEVSTFFFFIFFPVFSFFFFSLHHLSLKN